jgi:hypothetical protein
MPVVRHFSRSMWYVGAAGNVTVVAVSVFIFALLSLFMYPLMFKLGYKKGMILGYLLPLTIFYVVLLIYYLYMVAGSRNITLDFIVFASNNLLLIAGGLFALAAAVLTASYFISRRVFNRRDL